MQTLQGTGFPVPDGLNTPTAQRQSTRCWCRGYLFGDSTRYGFCRVDRLYGAKQKVR